MFPSDPFGPVVDDTRRAARRGVRSVVPAIQQLPRLQLFPSEDLAFRRFVDVAFGSLCADAAARGRPIDPQQLQSRLRDRYPAAVVRRREAIADPGPDDVLWYVYRFGSVTPGWRWWEEPGHAWAVFDDERRFVEVSTSLTQIVEAPREALLGRPLEAFSNPADVSVPEDAAGVWEELRRRGELHSTLRFRRLDGTPREIEYHLTHDGAGPGRHLAIVREIEPR
jgi:PAS domain-containing protein